MYAHCLAVCMPVWLCGCMPRLVWTYIEWSRRLGGRVRRGSCVDVRTDVCTMSRCIYAHCLGVWLDSYQALSRLHLGGRARRGSGARTPARTCSPPRPPSATPDMPRVKILLGDGVSGGFHLTLGSHVANSDFDRTVHVKWTLIKRLTLGRRLWVEVTPATPSSAATGSACASRPGCCWAGRGMMRRRRSGSRTCTPGPAGESTAP